MTVERRDEPIDERQRRTAQLHRLAEFGPLDQLEAGHVVVSSRPALAGRLATYPRCMISLEQRRPTEWPLHLVWWQPGRCCWLPASLELAFRGMRCIRRRASNSRH